MSLAGAVVAALPSAVDVATGTVESYDSVTGRTRVLVRGGVVPTAGRNRDFIPAAGDVVLLLNTGSGSWIILCAITGPGAM